MDNKERHKEKKLPKSTRTLPSTEITSPDEDVSQVISMLQEVIPKVEKKKTMKKETHTPLSNWIDLRPYLSHDFVEVNTVLPPRSISAIPWQSQEHIVIEELLSLLLGCQGKYIVAQPLLGQYNPREFTVADSIDSQLRSVVQQILPLARDHSIVSRFIEEKKQLKYGRVNQALAAAMESYVSDYTSFIGQLESLFRKNQLILQDLWVYLQLPIQSFQVLSKIANIINEDEAIGGRTLTILHEETQHYVKNENARKLCTFLAKKHLKRLHAPKAWMLDKLGGVYAPRPSTGPHKLRESLPLVIFLRNRLKYALTNCEVKRIVMQRLIKVDGKIRTDPNYPAGFMDVVTIEKTGEFFRLIYDVKGRFTIHRITEQEAKYKLCKVKRVQTGPKGIPFLTTHDARTIRYPDPLIKVNDTVQVDIATSKITDYIRFDSGNLCMITGGRNLGRVGTVVNRERHPGSFDIVHIKDANGHTFATRLVNVFIIGKGLKPYVSLPKGKGVKLSIAEERDKRLAAKAASG